ncbi:MAG: DUF2332 domain-containing protein [Acidobacteriota bacterium]|nr:DUF2332 domain-containing protein [Acidobacteriota bacterium]
MTSLDLDDARRRYEHALAPEDVARLPFYAALLRRLSQDATALELLASVRVQQRNPMLILAILQWLALGGHPVLGPLYDDVRRGALASVDEAVEVVVVVLREDVTLVSRELGRSTQTNEPGRSAVLRAVLADVARDHPRVNLVEVGCSAGINLHLDRFTVSERESSDPFVVTCHDVNGPLERALPSLGRRVGVDPHPLRLTNRDDQRWLKACLWPEEQNRHRRLDAIIDAWPTWEPLDVLRGTAKERLLEALEMTDDAFTVVVNTWVLFYLSDDEREWYFETVHAAARRGGVASISIESPLVVVPGVASAQRAHPSGASRIVVAREFALPEEWGWCHPHGRWLEKTCP